MAALLRRASHLSSRLPPLLLRDARHLSYLSPRRPPLASLPDPLLAGRSWGSSVCDFQCQFRRGYAKGKKSNDDGEAAGEVPDIGPSVKAAALSQMEAAMDALSRELAKLRTGRASAGMLDHITVETSGAKMSLNHVAVVSVLDTKTLSVTPYDPNSLKDLEHALVLSPLGLNPQKDGQRLLAVIPPLTKEHIQAMNKLVTKNADDVKQSIRRARQKALDSIKKGSSSMSKDDVKRLEKEVEDLTKKFVKSADDMCKAKEKEIMSG